MGILPIMKFKQIAKIRFLGLFLSKNAFSSLYIHKCFLIYNFFSLAEIPRPTGIPGKWKISLQEEFIPPRFSPTKWKQTNPTLRGNQKLPKYLPENSSHNGQLTLLENGNTILTEQERVPLQQ